MGHGYSWKVSHMDKLQSYCCLASLNIEDMSEKSGNIRRLQLQRTRERVNVDFILYTLTWVCSLFLVLPFIFSFHLPRFHSLPLHLPRSLRLSCSFSAICERAALCPRHINTQWPSQGLQQRAQVPFSVSLTDFYSSPSLPHFPFSLSHVSPSESNCTFFKFYTSGENAVIFKKTTQKSKFFLYTLPSFSLPSMCDPHLCSLVYSFSLLPHCFSHWKSVMCFCLLPLLHVSIFPPPIHAQEFTILELLSCSILISVYIIPECPNKIHYMRKNFSFNRFVKAN